VNAADIQTLDLQEKRTVLTDILGEVQKRQTQVQGKEKAMMDLVFARQKPPTPDVLEKWSRTHKVPIEVTDRLNTARGDAEFMYEQRFGKPERPEIEKIEPPEKPPTPEIPTAPTKPTEPTDIGFVRAQTKQRIMASLKETKEGVEFEEPPRLTVPEVPTKPAPTIPKVKEAFVEVEGVKYKSFEDFVRNKAYWLDAEIKDATRTKLMYPPGSEMAKALGQKAYDKSIELQEIKKGNVSSLREIWEKATRPETNVPPEDSGTVISFLGMGDTNLMSKLYHNLFGPESLWARKVGGPIAEKIIGKAREKLPRGALEWPIDFTPEMKELFEKYAGSAVQTKRGMADFLRIMDASKEWQRILGRKKPFTKEERTMLGQLLKKEIDPEMVDESLTKANDLIRFEIDRASSKLMDELQRQADTLRDTRPMRARNIDALVETIRKNRGTYLRRDFWSKLDPEWRPTEEVTLTAKEWLMANTTRRERGVGERPINENEAQRIVDHVLNKGKKGWRQIVKGGKTYTFKHRYLIRRKQIPQPIQDLLGVIDDPEISAPRSFMIANMTADQLRLLRGISENPEWASDRPMANSRLVEGKQHGMLDGKYVNASVADEIDNVYRKTSCRSA